MATFFRAWMATLLISQDGTDDGVSLCRTCMFTLVAGAFEISPELVIMSSHHLDSATKLIATWLAKVTHRPLTWLTKVTTRGRTSDRTCWVDMAATSSVSCSRWLPIRLRSWSRVRNQKRRRTFFKDFLERNIEFLRYIRNNSRRVFLKV